MKIWILMDVESETYGVEESYKYLTEKPLWKSYQSLWEYVTKEIEGWDGHPVAEIVDDKITKVYLVDGETKELWYYIILQEIEES